MNKLKAFIAVMTLSFGFVAFAAPAATPAYAQLSEVEKGVGFTGENPAGAEGKVKDIVKTVINILSLIVGIISVIMVIVGGFNYILSAGDSGKVSTAKNTIIYALVGLVIVALAQVIVQFVIDQIE